MLIGYVSDERYVAIADAALEFEQGGRSVVVRSTPRGAVYADLSPGEYRVTLVRDGFGSKRTTLRVPGAAPYQFRLALGLLARLRLAEVGENRRGVGVSRPLRRAISSQPVAVRLEEGVRPTPGLVRRTRPARRHADHARRRLHADRRQMEHDRLWKRPSYTIRSRGRSGRGCTTSTRRARTGGPSSRFPGSSRRRVHRHRSRSWRRRTPGTPTTTSAAAATTSTRTGCRPSRSSTRGRI